ncbi:hypothetical protein Afil01_33610 [Actinorhabdospora filicis]|uniref:Uncharacterized protein n=1 Tax=Actinorhabdospora filicis TaxID=1785913 RepID=A0A9W6SK88_9ACTN|nr:hypothetical protein [Actinorhabdospora filicis]GLZ78554.1 hypothetical protein Afil01_33610 [Actinorhabdospora filicis]
MRDDTEGVIASLTKLSAALRASGTAIDDPLAALAAESADSSRDELSAAITQAGQAADESGGAAIDLDEAATALRSYLDHVY